MKLFPLLSSLPKFDHNTVKNDIWGGLAAMLVALPSSIAFGVAIYTSLAPSLAPQGALAGIIGAAALGLIASLFGSGGRLITTPCAPAAAVLSALAVGFSQQGLAMETALLLLGLIGLLAGAVQLAMAAAGIGKLIKYIPYPVVSGYLSGVGLIIISSQIPEFLGAPAGRDLIAALLQPEQWSWRSIFVGVVTLAAMLIGPRLTRAAPAAILAVIAGVAACLLLALIGQAPLSSVDNPLLIGPLQADVASLGDSMQRNVQALDGFGLELFFEVLAPALTLGVLLAIDTLKTGLVIDAMTNSRQDPNRELIGQGLGNISAALLGGAPGAGSMGPSLINHTSGGSTRLSGFMCGVFALLALLLLSPLIAWTPTASLAAILIYIGARMIDTRSLGFFYSASTRLDFFVIIIVILVALFGNLIAASGVGVALAIMLFIREQTRSSVVRNRIEGADILNRLTGSREEREILSREVDAMIVFELQGSLFFGTANQLHAALEPEVERRKYLILSMRRVQSLDVTATHVLEQIKDRLETNNAALIFCDIPKGLPSGLKMKRFLKETGIVRPSAKAFAFRQLDEALEWVEAQTLANAPDAAVAMVDPQHMPAFAVCSPQALDALQQVLRLRRVAAGDSVFSVGAAADELFLVRSGRVKLLLPIRKKEYFHVATAVPGEWIGGRCFLDEQSDACHTATALALCDLEVWVLAHEDFETLATLQPQVAIAILKSLGATLAKRNQVIGSELQALRA